MPWTGLFKVPSSSAFTVLNTSGKLFCSTASENGARRPAYTIRRPLPGWWMASVNDQNLLILQSNDSSLSSKTSLARDSHIAIKTRHPIENHSMRLWKHYQGCIPSYLTLCFEKNKHGNHNLIFSVCSVNHGSNISIPSDWSSLRIADTYILIYGSLLNWTWRTKHFTTSFIYYPVL